MSHVKNGALPEKSRSQRLSFRRRIDSLSSSEIRLLFRVNVGDVGRQEGPVFVPRDGGGREGTVGHLALELELASLRDLLTASCFQLRFLN